MIGFSLSSKLQMARCVRRNKQNKPNRRLWLILGSLMTKSKKIPERDQDE